MCERAFPALLLLVACGSPVDADRVGTSAAGWAPAAKADTVCATGGTYATIQSAINAASSGATITICAGTYKERLTVSKSLTLDGAGATTVLDANKSGSAITLTGGASLTLKDVKVTNARTAGVNCTSSTLTASNVSFVSNKGSSGGGIYAKSCALSISASAFTTNTASSRGGGIYAESCSGTASGNTFSGNKASSKGGGVAAKTGTLTLSGNTFTDNAGSSGGGVYTEDDGDITGNTFSSNDAVYHGGGVYSEAGDGDYTGNTFSDNYAGEDGGGLYLNKSGAYVADNDFTGNYALDDAGALRALTSTATIEDNTFQSNTAADSGGAVKLSHKYGTFSRNTLGDNAAGTTGGGLYLDEDTTPVEDCHFEGNTAATGAGMYQSSGWRTTEVTDTAFVDNVASGNGGGISLYLVPYGVHLVRAEFDGNTAQSGAGLHADTSVTEVDNALFHWNVASSSGGGVYASGSETTVTNSVFYRNSAASGAAIYVSGDTGDGVRNSVVYKNRAGYAVTLASGALTWKYNNHYKNDGGEYSGMSNPAGSNGNVNIYPYFGDASAGDFTLTASSKMIDAGDPAILDADGSRSDMGVFGGPTGVW